LTALIGALGKEGLLFSRQKKKEDKGIVRTPELEDIILDGIC
jgi:hypothetical protein